MFLSKDISLECNVEFCVLIAVKTEMHWGVSRKGVVAGCDHEQRDAERRDLVELFRYW